MTAGVAVAFAVGLFAVLSPCALPLAAAFAGLPAALRGGDGGGAPGPDLGVGTAVRGAVAIAACCAVVFATAGLAFVAGLEWLLDLAGWVGAAAGLALAGAGAEAMIAAAWGSRPPSAGAVAAVARRRPLTAAVALGAVFAVAALPCMLTVFIAAVDQGVVASGAPAAAGVTIAFGAGCAAALTLPALAAAGLCVAADRAGRGAARLVAGAAGALVALCGFVLLLYWLPALFAGSVERGGASEGAATDLSAAITEAAARYELGFALVLLAISVVALAAAMRPRAG